MGVGFNGIGLGDCHRVNRSAVGVIDPTFVECPDLRVALAQPFFNGEKLMAGNGQNWGTIPTINAFQTKPAPQYVQASDVSFGASGVVMPHALPPSSMRFATPQANKMLNLPGVRSIFENKRNGSGF